MFTHPWRVVIVVAMLLIVGNLVLFGLDTSDTTRGGRTFPIAVETVNPLPGELLRPQDGITVDLRNDLTGVLLIDRVEVPEDQTDRTEVNGQVSFRPGPGKDIEKFEPGQYVVTVLYWPQGKDRPKNPTSYSWTFRAGA